MSRKIVLVSVLVLGLSLLSPNSWGAYVLSGKPAPPFVVESGDNQKLTRDMILGKVVVLFYETRQVVDKNDELKDELRRVFRVQPTDIREKIFRLVVIDCSPASFLTLRIWKSKLSEHSRREGFTIYGDWSQRMLQDYRMQGNESNFMIIDKRGIIRYSASGKISNSQFQTIINLLASMVQEG